MYRVNLLLFSWMMFACTPLSATGPEKGASVSGVHCVGKSRETFEKLFAEATSTSAAFRYGDFVRQFAGRFEGLRYGASPESCPARSTLVNFETFDCVTFVETFWAFAYTTHQFKSGNAKDKDPFNQFVRNLELIRYFGGKNCGISERIHYWTQGLVQLQKNGLAVNVAYANGKPFVKKVDYISRHKQSEFSGAFIRRTQVLEKILNETPRYYYPVNEIQSGYLPLAQDGDIIAFATADKGLDVTHTGIITVVDGELKVTHASSAYHRVMAGQDLMGYLSGRSSCNGIFIFRPVFN